MEQEAHRILPSKRIGGSARGTGTEWFACSAEEAAVAIQKAAGARLITETHKRVQREKVEAERIRQLRDFEERLKADRLRVEEERVEAYKLGQAYANGIGVEKNLSKVVEWYRKAAEQGYAVAQYYLGVCYKNGDGVAKYAVKAVEWCKKAAEQGCAKAREALLEWQISAGFSKLGKWLLD